MQVRSAGGAGGIFALCLRFVEHKGRRQLVEFFFETSGEVAAALESHFESHFRYGAEILFEEVGRTVEPVGAYVIGGGFAVEGTDFAV